MYEFTSTTLWNGDLYKKIVADKANKQVEIYRQGVYRNDANHHICLYWSKGHEGYLDVLNLDSLPSWALRTTVSLFTSHLSVMLTPCLPMIWFTRAAPYL